MRCVGTTNIWLTAVKAADFNNPIAIAYAILAAQNLFTDAHTGPSGKLELRQIQSPAYATL
jgi:hypothetical protein